ncbi:hypothetical protein [Legionella cardiaca]|uniref:Uncharacterized protein n=1 Tax=Legionella cardiaca TaxID=1071983 RepID=A0ABY8ANL4_9GAMM|nr:hypothetical protein [Legionella cardiaca]WED42242.1 hypothetical protein PXX05_09910 [Legionella cardiaca]
MNVFFDKKATSGYDKLLRQNEENVRKKRIEKAEEALQQLKQEIDNRLVKLQEILAFSDTKHALFQQLSEQYEHAPSKELAKQLSELKQALATLDNKLQQSQPEKIIADLQARYEALKAELSRKKTLLKSDEPPTAL